MPGNKFEIIKDPLQLLFAKGIKGVIAEMW